jgi:hypothetical protein
MAPLPADAEISKGQNAERQTGSRMKKQCSKNHPAEVQVLEFLRLWFVSVLLGIWRLGFGVFRHAF